MKLLKMNMQSIVCKRILSLLALMLVGNVLLAQLNITGKVVSKGGQPINGANVSVKGTNISTFTVSNGTFVLVGISAASTVELEVIASNYKTSTQNVSATAKDVEFILVADVSNMDEIIVTGTVAGTKKRQLVNSVSIVSEKDLKNTGAQSIDAALQGKVAGAQINQNSGNPAGGVSIRLRGPSTIVGSSEPLYIIDGVIVNNDSRQLIDLGGGAQNRLVDINMNDVERIEVIKGAAASAIYGSRAGNGVVQIFTKKGKDGKPQFTFSTSLKSSSLRKKLETNSVPFRFTNNVVTDLTTIPVTRYDYQDLIFRNAIGTDNNLAVSGGNNTTKYYVSASNYFNQGIIKGTDFNRNGLRMRLNQKVGNKVSFAVGANYVVSSSNDIPNGGIASDYGALTGFIFANNFVNPVKDPVTGLYPDVTVNGLGVKRTNPLEAIDRFEFKQRTNRMTTDLNFNYKPFAGFSIDVTTGFDNYTQSATAYIPPTNTTASFPTGLSRRADATVFQTNTDVNISYSKAISSKIQSTTILGGTMQYDKAVSFAANSTILGLFGQTINNGTIVAGEFREEKSLRGAFLQQTFGINNNLFINAAGRFDGSSVFSDQYSSQFYPKLGASYILSNEKFWSGLSNVVSFFKLRAAWGKSGNLTGLGSYDRFSNYTPNVYGTSVGYIPSASRGNVLVRPEKQTELEFGIDANFLNDKISLELNFFDKKVEDLILNRSLAPTTGFNASPLNVGNLSNRGIEVLIRATPVKTKKFEWNTSLSLSTNKNIVTNVGGNGTLGFANGFGLVAAVNGEQLGAHYGSFFARNPDGTLLLNAAGLPQRELGTQLTNGTYTIGRNTTTGQPQGAGLVKVIGRPIPKQVVSFINNFAIGRLSFKMQWDGMYGFDVFNFTKRVGSRADYGGLKVYEDELKGLVPKGRSIAVFSIFENWIEKGDFTKLRELSLSYNLPNKFWKFNNASLTLAGRNLFAITGYSGYDPETNAAGQDNAVRGFDFVEVPLPRAFNLTINLGF